MDDAKIADAQTPIRGADQLRGARRFSGQAGAADPDQRMLSDADLERAKREGSRAA